MLSRDRWLHQSSEQNEPLDPFRSHFPSTNMKEETHKCFLLIRAAKKQNKKYSFKHEDSVVYIITNTCFIKINVSVAM